MLQKNVANSKNVVKYFVFLKQRSSFFMKFFKQNIVLKISFVYILVWVRTWKRSIILYPDKIEFDFRLQNFYRRKSLERSYKAHSVSE